MKLNMVTILLALSAIFSGPANGGGNTSDEHKVASSNKKLHELIVEADSIRAEVHKSPVKERTAQK